MSDQNPSGPFGGQPSGDQPYGAPPPPPYGAGQQAYPQQQPAGGQPAYPPQAYPQQAYGGQYGGGYPTAPKTNTLAVVSLISSILGFTAVPFLGSVVGIITGHMALRQIRATGENGSGLAKAGLAIGYIVVVLTILAIIAVVAFAVAVPWETISTAP